MTYNLNFEITGCTNRCRHCFCMGLKSNRDLLKKEVVLEYARKFKDQLNEEIYVMLLQEQTFYPEFLELMTTLQEENLSHKKGLLVTNGFGLMHQEEMIAHLSQLFSAVKLTLFGEADYHDDFVKRPGHLSEIIEVSKRCKANGLNVIWQLMLTRDKGKEISYLIDLAKSLDIQYYVTGAFYQSGAVLIDNSFMPLESDLEQLDFEIYELEHSLYFPEYKSKQLIESILDQKINKVSMMDLYIDSELNVYFFNTVKKEFCLGNLTHDFDQIISMLKEPKSLPKNIQKRMALDFKYLIETYTDPESKEMHTPQTLFEKLSHIEMESSDKLIVDML